MQSSTSRKPPERSGPLPELLQPARRPPWLVPIGMLTVFLLLFGAILLLSHQSKLSGRRSQLASESAALGEGLRLRLKGNIHYLSMLAQQRSSGTLSSASFQERASQYVQFHPEMLNITWVDAGFTIRDVAPLASNRQIVGLHLDLPEPRRASREAMQSRRPVHTRPFEAIQGKPSFEVWVPVYQGDTFLGLFGGVYSCEQLLQQLISAEQRQQFQVSLRDGGGALLASLPAAAPVDPRFVHDVPLVEGDIILRLKAYREELQDWRIVTLELLCLVLVLAMTRTLWGLKRQIATRRQTEEALRASQARLEETLLQASMASWEYDAAADEFIFNDNLYAMLGTSAGDEGGLRMSAPRFVANFIQTDDRQLFSDALRSVASTREGSFSWQAEVRHVRRDGGILSTVMRFTAGRDASGRIVRCIGSTQDITERKRAETAATRQKTLLRSIIEGTNDAVFAKDAEGRYLLVNSEVLRLFGRQREEVLGRDDRHFFPPGEAEAVMQADREIMARQCIETREEQVTTNLGRRIFLATKGPIRDEQGGVIGLFGIARDITEHRRLEEQLRQSLKMESIGRLAGGVAHDFNNKLTVIMGYAEMSKLAVAEGSRLWQNLDQISRAAGHSRDITGQLLAFSRQQLISPKPMDLNRALADIQRTLPRLIGEDIALIFSLTDGLWTVKMDPTQFDQVVMNLAVNARDAMPDGGTLKIATANVTIDAAAPDLNLDAKPGDYVCLSFSDTGHGIDAESLKHVFEPFFTTKEIGKGTGLGLATIYGIVTQNGGFIDVFSEEGQGAVFRIYLPRLEEEAHQERREPVAEVSGSGTILLVEDDDTVRQMTQVMLEQIGYRVRAVPRPQDAVQVCQDPEVRIDLVLSDVIMPTMNGREMIEAMQASRPGLRVLFMSGYSFEIISEKGVVGDDTHFIQKPFTMYHLHQKIKEALAA